MNSKKQEWVIKSYALVAEKGFDSLSINHISRVVDKSKSSFYHYFGDIGLFKTSLLRYHIERADKFKNDISACGNLYPNLIDIFLDFKVDIFFHKQLRINRNEPIYNDCMEKVFVMYEKAVLDKWASYYGLNTQKLFAKKFHRFISEHLLLSITVENYTYEWLETYLKEVTEMIQQLKTGA